MSVEDHPALPVTITPTEPAQVVPFGKYRGQPVDALRADPDYCEWLVAQPWFRTRYSNVYNIVLSGGPETEDTPEHNQMQARFLDDDWCMKLLTVVRGDLGAARHLAEAKRTPAYIEFPDAFTLHEYPARVHESEFESLHGWDVIVTATEAIVELRRTEHRPPCTCVCDHADCRPIARCHGGTYPCLHEMHEADSSTSWGHCNNSCPRLLLFKHLRYRDLAAGEVVYGFGGRGLECHLEIKPVMGDDYPAVLRQITRRQGHGLKVLLVRRFAADGATWDQVQQIFHRSDVTALLESDLT